MKRVDVAYVMLFDERDEKILMVKNKGKNGSYFTLPGGAVEDGETLGEAAVREVKEETGLEIEVGNLLTVSEAFFVGRGHHAILFTFIGSITGGAVEIIYPDEIEQVTWMKVEEAERYLDISIENIKEMTTVPYIMRGIVN
ncbi:NUDIX hydrolase [Gracilibacillus oryzae]|uniref:NUDIX hydrolase n=1 Tax=Gracilibacillus oryzae TaxID=1672701 RepID=A0A7C8GUD1_9BACI|nr:NUDIX hydrolase [Gracilibacillus oryzae]KAB8138162.1 NUDIX hydrolase [Gracilibacillus oryzae]